MHSAPTSQPALQPPELPDPSAFRQGRGSPTVTRRKELLLSTTQRPDSAPIVVLPKRKLPNPSSCPGSNSSRVQTMSADPSSSPPSLHVLRLVIQSARNIPSFGSSVSNNSAFAKASVGEASARTGARRNSGDRPLWNSTFAFVVDVQRDDVVVVSVVVSSSGGGSGRRESSSVVVKGGDGEETLTRSRASSGSGLAEEVFEASGVVAFPRTINELVDSWVPLSSSASGGSSLSVPQVHVCLQIEKINAENVNVPGIQFARATYRSLVGRSEPTISTKQSASGSARNLLSSFSLPMPSSPVTKNNKQLENMKGSGQKGFPLSSANNNSQSDRMSSEDSSGQENAIVLTEIILTLERVKKAVDLEQEARQQNKLNKSIFFRLPRMSSSLSPHQRAMTVINFQGMKKELEDIQDRLAKIPQLSDEWREKISSLSTLYLEEIKEFIDDSVSTSVKEKRDHSLFSFSTLTRGRSGSTASSSAEATRSKPSLSVPSPGNLEKKLPVLGGDRSHCLRTVEAFDKLLDEGYAVEEVDISDKEKDPPQEGPKIQLGSRVTFDFIAYVWDAPVARAVSFASSGMQTGKGLSLTIGALHSHESMYIPRGVHAGLIGQSQGTHVEITLKPEMAFGEEGTDYGVPPNSYVLYDLQIRSVDSQHLAALSSISEEDLSEYLLTKFNISDPRRPIRRSVASDSDTDLQLYSLALDNYNQEAQRVGNKTLATKAALESNSEEFSASSAATHRNIGPKAGLSHKEDEGSMIGDKATAMKGAASASALKQKIGENDLTKRNTALVESSVEPGKKKRAPPPPPPSIPAFVPKASTAVKASSEISTQNHNGEDSASEDSEDSEEEDEDVEPPPSPPPLPSTSSEKNVLSASGRKAPPPLPPRKPRSGSTLSQSSVEPPPSSGHERHPSSGSLFRDMELLKTLKRESDPDGGGSGSGSV